MINGHCAELMTFKKLSVFTHSLLHKESWTTRHLNLNENSNDNQDRPKKEQSKKSDYSVKQPLENHIT